MRNRALGCLVVAGLALGTGFDWRAGRGDDAGTMRVPSPGDITGRDAPPGFPVIAGSVRYSTDGYVNGRTLLGDFLSGTPGLEVIIVSQDRLYLLDQAGETLAASDAIAGAAPVGVYDLDGDSYAAEVVVAGNDLGGGVLVLDAASLSVLWRSEDREGQNSGVDPNELKVADIDGDGASELAWNIAYQGFTEYHIARFVGDTTRPAITTIELPTTYVNFLPAALGNFFGEPGDVPRTFVVNQYTSVTFFSVTEAGDPDVVDCSSDDLTLCLRVDLDAEFPNVYATHSLYGWAGSVDVDGDGRDEYLSASGHTSYANSTTLFDPRAALGGAGPVTASGVRWAYRYPLYATQMKPYADALRGVRSSLGESVFAMSVYNDNASESTWNGTATSDCVNFTTGSKWATVVLDAATGKPLQTLTGTTGTLPYGAVDGDGDGTSEIVIGSYNAAGTAVSTFAGYELECAGPDNASAWTGCGAASGCTLTSRWSIAGYPLVVRREAPDPSEVQYGRGLHSQPLWVDFTGDGVEEVVSRNGNVLKQHAFDVSGTPVERASFTLPSACNSTPLLTGEGADAKLLFEGTTCILVLDANLQQVFRFDVGQNQGAAQAISAYNPGPLGDGATTLAIGGKVWFDATNLTSAPQLDLGSYLVVRAEDFDEDGIDELVAIRPGTGSSTVETSRWDLRVYRWTGTTYTIAWQASATALGDTRDVASAPYTYGQVTTGDHDGDGDPDLALYAAKSTPTAPNLGALYFFDGRGAGTGTGYRLLRSAVSAPGEGTASSMAAGVQLHTQEVCASCVGEEVLLPLVRNNLTAYSATAPTAYLSAYRVTWPTGYVYEALFADFDGDGVEEVVGVTDLLSIYHNNLSMWEFTSGTPRRWYTDLPNASGTFEGAAAADVDGDSLPDVVLGNAFGGLMAYKGTTGAGVPGFPYYLAGGAGSSVRPARGGKHLNSLVMVDIDGDGYDEALVGHDDGYLYAVDLSSAEQTDPEATAYGMDVPAVLWAVPMRTSVRYVRALDADRDGSVEVLAFPNDGSVYLIDAGEARVVIDSPTDAECVTGDSFVVSGTAAGVTSVYIENQCDYASAHTVAVSGGSWSSDPMPWVAPDESACTVRVYGQAGGLVVTNAAVSVTHSFDADHDGYSPVCAAAPDCNDADGSIHPDAAEIPCDGIDQDCDGVAGGIGSTDDDGDGYIGCVDCDDDAFDVHPGAVEVPYDGINNDCADGDWNDVDGDGVVSTYAGGPDCDDSDADVLPGVFEVPDGVDEDCDGVVDEGTVAFDDDGDGFTESGGDCNDYDDYVHPDGSEVVNDVDDDCNGHADDGTVVFDDDGDCSCEGDATHGECTGSMASACAEFVAGDCDDSAADIALGLAEAVDGVDNDCDGIVDEGTAVSDDDGDGVTEAGGDCDDAAAAVVPGATEIANGADDDCDGTVDEGTSAEVPDALDTDVPAPDDDPTVYAGSAATDDDGDGVTEAGGDCDDTRAGVSPSREELCTIEGQDPVDENCNGSLDEDCEQPVVEPEGCGCSTPVGGAPGLSALGGLLALVVVRRRRAA